MSYTTEQEKEKKVVESALRKYIDEFDSPANQTRISRGE